MQIEEFLVELKASLRHYDKRDIIDDASIYRWIEIALKKFGGDITIPKDIVLDVKRKQAVMPGDYYDLILAYRCDFAGYEVPGGKKLFQNCKTHLLGKSVLKEVTDGVLVKSAVKKNAKKLLWRNSILIHQKILMK